MLVFIFIPLPLCGIFAARIMRRSFLIPMFVYEVFVMAGNIAVIAIYPTVLYISQCVTVCGLILLLTYPVIVFYRLLGRKNE